MRSLLPAERRATFDGLRFFPYDKRFRVHGVLEAGPTVRVTLATSDGRSRLASRVGTLKVVLPGGEGALAVFRLDDAASAHLFVPFRDAAAGHETYGAGRYLEVHPRPGGLVEVDFNRAYNPDCAFGITASCPVAPSENTLSFAVPAGEMSPLAGRAR
ncbi:MAG TPA: DUF1684 domain-containing protein [Thermoanaerobaculaceae bacterium]|nr:DUF1684 domain-containing protein [Thermoanaerobaculaceae bacterium]HRS14711.1 DUF1684 domain-containing protein [Thermoanaerobaculaceae bacterium]